MTHVRSHSSVVWENPRTRMTQCLSAPGRWLLSSGPLRGSRRVNWVTSLPHSRWLHSISHKGRMIHLTRLLVFTPGALVNFLCEGVNLNIDLMLLPNGANIKYLWLHKFFLLLLCYCWTKYISSGINMSCISNIKVQLKINLIVMRQ